MPKIFQIIDLAVPKKILQLLFLSVLSYIQFSILLCPKHEPKKYRNSTTYSVFISYFISVTTDKRETFRKKNCSTNNNSSEKLQFWSCNTFYWCRWIDSKTVSVRYRVKLSFSRVPRTFRYFYPSFSWPRDPINRDEFCITSKPIYCIEHLPFVHLVPYRATSSFTMCTCKANHNIQASYIFLSIVNS